MTFLNKKATLTDGFSFFVCARELLFRLFLKLEFSTFRLKMAHFANFHLQKAYYSFAFRIEIRFSLSIVLLEIKAEITTTTRAMNISSSATRG